MRAPRGKILVIRGGAIGDFILTLPAIRALRERFPDAYLEVLGYPHIAQLALAGGLVDKVQSIEARALAQFFASSGQLSEDLVDYFSEFDLILSYLYDPDGIFRANVGRCTSAQYIEGPHRPSAGSSEHATKVFLRPLERLAIFDADHVPRLQIKGESRFSPVGGRPVFTLAMHPGSGSEQKNWPQNRWSELLELVMTHTDLHILLVGGEAEGENLQLLAAALPPERVRVAQSLALADLAILLQRCHAFIGHDSGISHLAGALNLPTLILWGDTFETVWKPPGEKVTLLKHPSGLGGLSAEAVMSQLRRILSVSSS